MDHDDDEESFDGSSYIDDDSPLGHSSRMGRSPDVMSRLTPDSSNGRNRSGRSRGRPRGSRARGPIASRGRGPGVPSAAVAAAELAGALAGKNAALAAYASFSPSATSVRPRSTRGRGRTTRGNILNFSTSNAEPSPGPSSYTGSNSGYS